MKRKTAVRFREMGDATLLFPLCRGFRRISVWSLVVDPMGLLETERWPCTPPVFSVSGKKNDMRFGGDELAPSRCDFLIFYWLFIGFFCEGKTKI